MNRRLFLAASCAATLLPQINARAQSPLLSKTKWVVRGSEGFDALAFMAPLSGDPFYARYYEKEVAEFAPRMPEDAMVALRALKAEVAATDGLLSPAFYLFFSGGPDATINDLIYSIDHSEILKLPLQASPYWDEEGWNRFLARLPVIRFLLLAMRDAGFSAFRASIFDPKAATRLPEVHKRLQGFDVVAEVERYTGRTLDPAIEIIFSQFAKPHGVKVIGQKFLTGIDYNDNITIRTAVHELLHPPIDMGGPAAAAALAVLNKDALFRRILAERDPAYGYGTMQGLFDEDLVQALDQTICERMGVAPSKPMDRWHSGDGGMHVLAAGFYGLMHRDSFAETGGSLENWVCRKAVGGWLEPVSLHGAAAQVLKRLPGNLWPPARN